jgi:hypothetical protein
MGSQAGTLLCFLSARLLLDSKSGQMLELDAAVGSVASSREFAIS